MAATYRHVNMKALARYQIILFGEQRHIGVSNLPRVVAGRFAGREPNPRPFDHESDMLTTTRPSHPLWVADIKVQLGYLSAKNCTLSAATSTKY